jgi:hypothetical protein
MPFALALAFILLATTYRIVGAWVPDLINFSPLMALTFCSAVYFRNKWMWAVPFAALSLSDLYLNHYYVAAYGESWPIQGELVRTACFAAALAFGAAVSSRKSWLNLLSGCLGGSLFFYVATNTHSWLADPAYAKTAAGWWQALTIGRPEYPPTLLFFRNTFISDLLFTGAFALALEYVAAKRGQPNLIGAPAATKA